MTKFLPLFTMLLLCLTMGSHQAGAVELVVYCNPTQLQPLASTIADWEKETGNTVVFRAAHESSSEALAFYQQLLHGGDNSVDIFNIDSVWPSILSQHLVDLRVFMAGLENQHIQGAIDSYTVNERLVAMPLFVDVGVMYYRKDLLDKYNLSIPFTWNRLIECANKVVTAERANGNDDIWGLVFQGKPYEGLTCCALEWLVANEAGTLVDADGRVTINNPRSIQTFAGITEWIGSLAPEETLPIAEEESREMIREGKAVFMRNWPYAWLYLQEEESRVKGKVGVMPIPKGSPNGNSPGVMGGWGLAVSKYSRHREAAASLVFYLTGPVGQKKFCLLDNHIPSLASLFYDPDVRKQIPMAVMEFFTAAVQRPTRQTGKHYDIVSREFFTSVHNILSGKVQAEPELERLENTLNKLKHNGWK